MINFFLKRKRNQVDQLIKQNRTLSDRRLRFLFLQLLILLGLHTVAMMLFEGLAFSQAAWLTLTTVTTVGYGDVSAVTTWGRVSTVVLLYVIGIWMVAQLAGEYIDYRVDRRERIKKGLWSWTMNDHIVIVNAPENGELFLLRLIRQFRATPALAERPVILVTHLFPEGLPRALTDLGVVYKHVNTSQGNFFNEVNIAEANYVLFLAQDAQDPSSDSLTLDLLDQFREHRHDAILAVAEAVQDNNLDRFKRTGADSVLRPIRAYPELLVRALSAPGTERILEDLFTHFGASIHRYDLTISEMPWKTIATALIQQEAGTALGYITLEGEVRTCPSGEEMVTAKALLLMARDEAIPQQAVVEQCLNLRKTAN